MSVYTGSGVWIHRIATMAVVFMLMAGAVKAPAQTPPPGELEPKSVSAEQSALRTWSDRTGKFRTQAKYLGTEDGKVKLEKEDGTVIQVPIEKLSDADQRFVSAAQTPQETAAQVITLKPQQPVMGSIVNSYRPIHVSLSTTRPKGLKTEPAYKSKSPLYGILRLGAGPKNKIALVVDEADGEKPRVYIDRNNDGDLTNDGLGEWSNVSDATLSLSHVLIDAPYGDSVVPYMLEFYRFRTREKDKVFYYRNCCREGEIVSGEKRYKIAVLNETADGQFDGLANGTLLVDLNQDGKLEGDEDSAEWHALNKPFNIHGQVWKAVLMSPDGMQLTVQPSKVTVAMRPYLNPGCPAPLFKGKALDGKTVDLNKQRGESQYVLLDFWALWCGPCRGEFPGLRRIHARYKDHGLQIVGINLDKDRKAAVKAAKDNGLNYPHVFDGKGWQNTVAVLYRVHGIPQTYLLDKDLNIVAKGLRSEALEKRLQELLGAGDEDAAKSADKTAEATKGAEPLADNVIASHQPP